MANICFHVEFFFPRNKSEATKKFLSGIKIELWLFRKNVKKKWISACSAIFCPLFENFEIKNIVDKLGNEKRHFLIQTDYFGRGGLSAPIMLVLEPLISAQNFRRK